MFENQALSLKNLFKISTLSMLKRKRLIQNFAKYILIFQVDKIMYIKLYIKLYTSCPPKIFPHEFDK